MTGNLPIFYLSIALKYLIKNTHFFGSAIADISLIRVLWYSHKTGVFSLLSFTWSNNMYSVLAGLTPASNVKLYYFQCNVMQISV